MPQIGRSSRRAHLEGHLNTPEFENQCYEKARQRALSFDSDSDSDIVSAAYEVSKDEARRYYAGVNILSLGPEYTSSKLVSLMYDRIDVPSEFKYPDDGLLHLRGMLTADQINNPNSLNIQGDRIRRVIKRGFATNTTVGTLTKYKSFVHKYIPTGDMESLELPILSHEKETGTFSKEGDSGSLIVSALSEFVGLLTGGTNEGTDASDITFATHFEWVWELVCKEFRGANLYFDNLQAFLADVA